MSHAASVSSITTWPLIGGSWFRLAFTYTLEIDRATCRSTVQEWPNILSALFWHIYYTALWCILSKYRLWKHLSFVAHFTSSYHILNSPQKSVRALQFIAQILHRILHYGHRDSIIIISGEEDSSKYLWCHVHNVLMSLVSDTKRKVWRENGVVLRYTFDEYKIQCK